MIKRHEMRKRYSEEYIPEDYESRLRSKGKITKKIQNNESDIPYFMNSLHGIYLELAAFELYFDNKAEELFWSYLQKSVQCCLGFYRLALSSNKTELIQLDDIGEYELQTGTYIRFITPWHYRSHFKLALLARSNELLNLLGQLDESKFSPDEAGLSGAEFHWAGYRYIKELLYNRDNSKIDELHKKSWEAMVEYYDDEGKSHSDSVIFFDLELTKAIRKKDSDYFNYVFKRQIEEYREYYGQAGKQGNADGLFATYPAGLAAFAYDQGLEITVESDYLPRFLIEGRYAEEKIKWPLV